MSTNGIEETDSLCETDDLGDAELCMIEEEVVYTQEFLPTYHSIREGDTVTKTQVVEFNEKPESLFFNDGVRRIDFILVYEDEDKKEFEKRSMYMRRKRRREYFEASLVKMGLELEATPSVVNDKLMFVKVHLPWDVLCTYAEVLHIKLPIRPNDMTPRPSMWRFFTCITKHFYPDEKMIQGETEFFTAPFEKNRQDCFHIKDKDLFFTPSMRSRMACYILSRAQYELRGTIKKFGITKLLSSGVYKAAYPLHDCQFNVKSKEEGCPSERYLLYKEWANPINFYKMQPLDLIRKYYGEKVGIYFAWLGFYTMMLAVAAVMGLGCFIYGYKTQETSTWSKEVCDPNIGGKIVMCPQCDLCKYWILNSTCETSQTLSVFDNFGTLVFAVFMSIWVTLFLEFWKRYQAELEYEWDTVEFLEQEEPPRPEYEAKCIYDRKNPITGVTEKVPFTSCGRCVRVSIGIGTVFFWILLILASIVAIIVYRLAVFITFSYKLRNNNLKNLEPIKEYVTPQMATSVTASIISFVVIMILNILYERVAIWITNFELPRTRTDYENSLTMKMFLFQFVNYYSSCFYIAFVKGKIVGYPGKPVRLLGEYRNEECDPGGCLIELTTQLAIIMGGKAIWNNIQEVLLPWVKNWIFRRCSASVTEKVTPRWEQDYQLQSISQLGLFYEYLEMVIQFGFVTLFVASFPLAPVLALINNLFEIRVDAWKLTTQSRRIVPEKAQDIGAWQPILQGIAILAVATNAMIIAFTSDMIPRLVYYWSFSVYPYSDNTEHTMQGYINSSLSVFNISDSPFNLTDIAISTPSNITTCRYRDFRYPPGHLWQYEHNIQYWHVIGAKLAFIIVVEHIVYFTKFVLSYVIPDVPYAVKERIKREKYLTQVILHETSLKVVTRRLKPLVDNTIGKDVKNVNKEEEMEMKATLTPIEENN
ncbi:Anoctamin-6 [Oryzias melastigma]|uniref:Anoctamin n=1 Tax=Oryzias melastigma TaxID=30732 RepID=A0A834KY53_ORYME|nr:Anoctamin-6 [Oryzias melastigma]